MGDGRYYSPEQFFSIILFTTLIIFLVITFMLNLYKVEKHKGFIRILGLTLLASLLSAFIYEIAYTSLAIILSDQIKYLTLLMYLLTNLIVIIKHKDDRRFIVFLFLILLLIPTLMILKTPLETKSIYILYTVHYSLISNKFTKYKVSSSAFNDVKKLMLDYVFIISKDGDIIFKNDKAIDLDIFSVNRFIDINNIDRLFKDKTTMRNAFSKQFIKVESRENLYFQFHQKEIMNKGKVAGYILTFTDITQLISMLDRLGANREETKKTNIELDKYKDIVYDIEKEKEINTLLDEIANNQQKSMYILKNKLERLDINDKNFLVDLEDISIKAKSNLHDVREAVTSYVKYYQ